MTIPLATKPDPEQVAAVRPLLEGRACVVVGSAPLRTPHADVGDDEAVIAVNGGISSCPRTVDLWVVASRREDRPGNAHIKPLHRTMLQQAKGRTMRHVLLLRGPKEATEKDTLVMFQALGCRYENWSVLDKPTKRWLETELCARLEKEPCSSGILATAIALWCGAASVRLVGFSVKPGYHYIPGVRLPSWARNHVAADRRAVRALLDRYPERFMGVPFVAQLAAAS